MNRFEGLMAQLCEMARQAGAEIMRFYPPGAEVTWKKDASPLTVADRASHTFLTRALKSLTPEICIVSEESEDEGRKPPGEDGMFWLVDPLDGTKEFLKGTNEFTVNIALIENGVPILGVVHVPALHLTYYGGRSSGAWRQIGNDAPSEVSTRHADLSQLTVVASKDHAGPLVTSMLGRLSNPNLRSMGSSLKFCLVAEGKADIYLRDIPTMEWDTAAAQSIVEAAGGKIYTLDGRPLRYGKVDLKNPAIITIGDTNFEWQPLIS
jgi:3'(2'), 5'-bisphosphate nucleotidase